MYSNILKEKVDFRFIAKIYRESSENVQKIINKIDILFAIRFLFLRISILTTSRDYYR